MTRTRPPWGPSPSPPAPALCPPPIGETAPLSPDPLTPIPEPAGTHLEKLRAPECRARGERLGAVAGVRPRWPDSVGGRESGPGPWGLEPNPPETTAVSSPPPNCQQPLHPTCPHHRPPHQPLCPPCPGVYIQRGGEGHRARLPRSPPGPSLAVSGRGGGELLCMPGPLPRSEGSLPSPHILQLCHAPPPPDLGHQPRELRVQRGDGTLHPKPTDHCTHWAPARALRSQTWPQPCTRDPSHAKAEDGGRGIPLPTIS